MMISYRMSVAKNIAVIGEGVVGLSTTIAILEKWPQTKITVFYDRPFEEICSFGPAGLFRIDRLSAREYGKVSFDRFTQIYKKYPGNVSGVKLLSGHIQSDNKETLDSQEKNFGDYVFNFRWLNKREIDGIFDNPSKYCIHYTAFASEGNLYTPFLKNQCEELGAKFEKRTVKNLDELGASYDVVVNCAGLDGGKLAGDDDTVKPSRGIAIEVEANWHKHFNYRDFTCFTIPKNNTVVVGTVKEVGKGSLEITDEDRRSIWENYLKLHPQMKGARVIKEWCGVRPERESVRVETQRRQTNGKDYLVVHNYGHGSNGFTLGWGTAVHAVGLLEKELGHQNKL